MVHRRVMGRGGSLLALLILAAALATSGCTGADREPLSATVTPAPTLPPAPAQTLTAVTVVVTTADPADRAFLDAVSRCYDQTPVISDTLTNLEFTACIQHAPLPSGTCERQFRSDILEYSTKDDDTTAGYQRETFNMRVARTRYAECLT